MRFFAFLFGWWVFKPYSVLIAIVLRFKGIKVGRNFYIQGVPFLKLRGKASNVVIGNNVRVNGDIDLRNRENGRIVIEDDVSFDTGCRIVAAREAVVTFRRRADIGNCCIFNCGADLTVGEDTMMAGFCYIQSSDHGLSRGMTIKNQPHSHKPVAIGRDVWLGANVTVLPGITISEGAVVGAKAVVNTNLPAYSIAVGIPAKVIGERPA